MRTTKRRTLTTALAASVAVIAPLCFTPAATHAASPAASHAAGESSAVEGQSSAATNGRLLFGRSGDLYSILPNGTGLKRLTRTSFVTDAQWSPDGTRIAFADIRYGTDDIFTMRADGTGITRITTATSKERTPSWSKDGKWLAFASLRNDVSDIYRLNATAPFGAAKRLTRGFYDKDGAIKVKGYANPRWSPIDNTVLVTEYIYRADWSESRRLVLIDGTTGAMRPWSSALFAMTYDWNPSGKQFVVSVDRSLGQEFGRTCLMRVPVPNGATRPINNCNNPDPGSYSPVWSPDDSLVAYALGGAGSSSNPGDIHVIRPDGTGDRLLLRNALPWDWASS